MFSNNAGALRLCEAGSGVSLFVLFHLKPTQQTGNDLNKIYSEEQTESNKAFLN